METWKILGQRTYPTQWHGFVPTVSGKGYYPFTTAPGTLPLTDIAYGLSAKNRYGGQTKPLIPVAEHCVMVAEIIRILWPSQHHEKAGLLHDACEAVVPDLQGPLRKLTYVSVDGVKMSWDDNDTRLTRILALPFGVSHQLLGSNEVRAADLLAASMEKRDIPTLPPESWGLPPIPEAIEHLKVIGLSQEDAYQAFLARAEELGVSLSS